jgi:structural maintenance of chromosome 3 (chondroitin sulfate proteoglycan 6)
VILQIVKRLHTVMSSLKAYSHVNKKAFEQYANFTKQRETLTKRRTELDSSQASIEELIEVLDQRKDEAIERTFKQVSREFANVFERLVPAGRGRLIIQRKTDRRPVADEEEDDDEEDERHQDEDVENYTGVGISVSFNSKHDEQQRIQQLSGGQKSLCALALVFAIQQCDPAPFYLFDEIDANLDAQYRTAVAGMLKSIAEKGARGDQAEGGGQFICTTFRPEMVLVADKCYGVAYAGKTSSIDVVKREEALEFVEGQKV